MKTFKAFKAFKALKALKVSTFERLPRNLGLLYLPLPPKNKYFAIRYCATIR